MNRTLTVGVVGTMLRVQTRLDHPVNPIFKCYKLGLSFVMLDIYRVFSGRMLTETVQCVGVMSLVPARQ